MSTNKIISTKKKLKYTSHEVQNEVLIIMSTQIICDIRKEIISANFFILMIYEAADVSKNRTSCTSSLCQVNLTVVKELPRNFAFAL